MHVHYEKLDEGWLVVLEGRPIGEVREVLAGFGANGSGAWQYRRKRNKGGARGFEWKGGFPSRGAAVAKLIEQATGYKVRPEVMR